jgi:HAD superfamily phosphatase (TIGR01668 family)
VRRVASVLGLPHARGRFKPSASKLRDALAILGSAPARTAMVGDQLFTDILAGNRLGVPTVLTLPLAPQEPWRMVLMRSLERRVLAVLAHRGLASPPEV